MRPIKFRAWDEEEERFFYSGDENDDNHFFEFKGDTLRGFAIRPPRPSSDPMEPPEPYTDDYPAVQYTGQKDKNGKEIYGGDKIKQAGHIIGGTKKEEGNVEQAHNGRWFVRLMWESGMECHADIAEDAEIIGNIHTTPKLLEQDNGE